ncbi:MAG TPA: aldehyde dehydrogenase, partial [Candidatus Limnocylindria bacterium]|nr:aldehyde dehydrogenase [Candidatus Limnocylindria bacterium]
MKKQTIISLNPAHNYKVIGQVPVSSHAEIDLKIAQAHKAAFSWAQRELDERIAVLEKLYTAFKTRKNEIRAISSQEMGMPISVADIVDFEFGLNYMRGYLDNAQQWLSPEIVFKNNDETHYLYFEPKGVAAVSVPWNFPFLMFVWGAVQNLIAGNTVVFKHSEECPLTGKLLEEITDSINLPEGVFNAVYGDGSDVGDYLMNGDINFIYFTGSTNVGRHLYQTAARKLIPIMLELGGSAPGIVFEDAAIDEAVESIYLFRYLNSGQSCDALKRLIVHETIFDD